MIGKTSTGYDDHQPDGPEHCTDQTELVISNAAGEAGCSQSTVSDLRNPIQQTLTEDGLRTNAGQVSKDPKEREKDKRFVVSVLGLFLVILSGWSYLNLRGAYGELRPHHYGFNVEHILLFLLFTGFCVAWLVIKFLPDLIAIWRGTSLSMTWKQNNLVSIFFFPTPDGRSTDLRTYWRRYSLTGLGWYCKKSVGG